MSLFEECVEGLESKSATELAILAPKLYLQVRPFLLQNGFDIEFDPSNPYTYHRLYIKSSPGGGLMCPPDFRYLRLVSSVSDLSQLYEAFGEITDSVLADFVRPLFFPTEATKRSSAWVNFCRNLQQQLVVDKAGNKVFDLGITTKPTVSSLPKAFIPPREWFPQQLHSVRVEDVVKVLPAVELKWFKLFWGRACYGRKNNLHVDADVAISHGFRYAICLVGDAHIGKSMLVTKMRDAMELVGYRTTLFKHLGDRFGGAKIADSLVSFKDDVTVDTMKQLLSSETFKSLVSNDPLETEAKFQDAKDTWSHTAVVFNANVVDQSMLDYKLDPGSLDRIKFLSLLPMRKLEELGPMNWPGELFRKYSNELNISETLLALWLCRLCVDEFEQLLPLGAVEFREEINKLTKGLAIGPNNRAMQSLLKLMMMCSGEDSLPSQLHKGLLQRLVTNAAHFACDPRMSDARNKVKQHWISAGKPDDHPWYAMKTVDPDSHFQAWQVLQEQIADNRANLANTISTVFKEYASEHTLAAISHKPSVVNREWSTIVEFSERYQQVAIECGLTGETFARAGKGTDWSVARDGCDKKLR